MCLSGMIDSLIRSRSRNMAVLTCIAVYLFLVQLPERVELRTVLFSFNLIRRMNEAHCAVSTKKE